MALGSATLTCFVVSFFYTFRLNWLLGNLQLKVRTATEASRDVRTASDPDVYAKASATTPRGQNEGPPFTKGPPCEPSTALGFLAACQAEYSMGETNAVGAFLEGKDLDSQLFQHAERVRFAADPRQTIEEIALEWGLDAAFLQVQV